MNASGQGRYQLVGRCEAVTAPMAALTGMPEWLTVAEPETHQVVSRHRGTSALQPWSVHFKAPEPGQMVEAEGWLQVMAQHEWALPVPDSRMDWRIRGIRLLRHRMVPVPDEQTDVFTFGPVVKVTELERLDPAAERLRGAHYLLDLTPAQRTHLRHPLAKGAGCEARPPAGANRWLQSRRGRWWPHRRVGRRM